MERLVYFLDLQFYKISTLKPLKFKNEPSNKQTHIHTYKHISTAILVHILLYYECAHLQNRDDVKTETRLNLNMKLNLSTQKQNKQTKRTLALTLLSFSVTVKLRYTYFDLLHTLPSDDEMKLKKKTTSEQLQLHIFSDVKKPKKLLVTGLKTAAA